MKQKRKKYDKILNATQIFDNTFETLIHTNTNELKKNGPLFINFEFFYLFILKHDDDSNQTKIPWKGINKIEIETNELKNVF